MEVFLEATITTLEGVVVQDQATLLETTTTLDQEDHPLILDFHQLVLVTILEAVVVVAILLHPHHSTTLAATILHPTILHPIILHPITLHHLRLTAMGLD